MLLDIAQCRLDSDARQFSNCCLVQFGAGDGFLHFYLYNWATRPIAGGCVEPAMAAAGLRSHPKGQPSGGFIPEKGSGIGVVML